MDASQIKSIKNTKILASIVLLIFGLTFIIWPGDIKDMLAKVIGLVFAIAGVVELIIEGVKKDKNVGTYITMVISVVVAGAGIFFAIKPSSLIALFGYLFGSVIVAVGLYNAYHAVRFSRKTTDKWWINLILSAGAAIFGVIVITKSGEVTDGLIRFIGIALVVIAFAEMGNFFTIKAKIPAKKEE